MVPIVGITGSSGVGKTTLAVKIIEELRSRGYEVGAIKHTTHKVDIDQPGKDSDLMYKAGAGAVALASSGQVACYMPCSGQWTPREIADKLFPEVDIVVAEGFGDFPMPRLAVLRKGVSEELRVAKGVIAVAADFNYDTDHPLFGFDQVTEIAHLFESYITRHRSRREVSLYVNGRPIFLKPFVKDFILKPVAGMVEALKGTEGARRIQVVIDRPSGEDYAGD